MKLPAKPAGELATDQQWEAIHYPTGQTDILLSASAGSGKTRVLVDRVLNLISYRQDSDAVVSEGVDIDRLLVITFTNAAAREMKEKIEKKIKQAIPSQTDSKQSYQLIRQLNKLPQAQISTIHSFCLEIIHRFYYLIDLDPVFRQLTDESESAMIKEELWQDLREDYYSGDLAEEFIQLNQVFSTNLDEEKLAEVIKSIYQLAIAQADPFQWLDQLDRLYRAKDEKQFYQSELWSSLLKPQLLARLNHNLKLLSSAIDMLVDDEVLDQVKTLIQAEVELNQKLVGLLEKDQFDSGRTLVLDFNFPTYPRKKVKDEAIKAIKDEVKVLRDQAKMTIVNDFKNDIFIFDLHDHLQHAQEMQKHLTLLKKITKDFIQLYGQYKTDHQLVDFNDLEHLAYQILQAKNEEGVQEAALYYQTRFVEILIDEYQDTNPLQEKIIESVSKSQPQANRFMVGDVKQSIYRFRMAEPSLFMQKYQNYGKEGQANSGRRIILQDNFRSRPEVLNFTNFIFKRLMDQELGEMDYDQQAELVPAYKDFPISDHMQAELLIYESDTAGAETQWDDNINFNFFSNNKKSEISLLGQKIKSLVQTGFEIYDKELKKNRPIQYSDIVILTRTKTSNAHIQSIFSLMDIPLILTSTQNYFQSIEVTIMLNLLSLIDNPRQDIPLAAVLRSSIVGLDENDLATIRLACPGRNYYKALETYIEQADEEDPCAKQVKDFMNKLEKWRTLSRRVSLAELIRQIYNDTGFLEYVAGLPAADQRQANLHALYEKALAYESSQFKGLYKFIRFIEKMQNRQDDLNDAMVLTSEEEAVKVMTIHNAKGLEFPVVFLLGFSSDMNDSDFNADFILDKSYGLALNYINTQDRYKAPALQQTALSAEIKAKTYAEEMRVLYVALTRAEQKIYIIGNSNNQAHLFKKWQGIPSQQAGTIDLLSRLKARSILHWLGLALYPYIDFKQASEDHYESTVPQECPFSINFVNKDQLAQSIIKDLHEEKDRFSLDQLAKTIPEEPSELGQLAVQLMEANYNYPYATQTSSFQSVSEIKRVFEDPDQEQLLTLDASKPKGKHRFVVDQLDRPRFISEQKQLSPAEVGQASHLLMQALDFSHLAQAADIKKELEQLVEKGHIHAELADLVDIKSIVNFMKSPLAQRMVQGHTSLAREVPFSLKLPAKDIFRDIEADEDILIHGIVDGYFEENGELVLFDYKTDRLPKNQQAARDYLLKEYQGQLKLYQLALENILHKKVKDSYIIGLEQTLIIKV